MDVAIGTFNLDKLFSRFSSTGRRRRGRRRSGDATSHVT